VDDVGGRFQGVRKRWGPERTAVGFGLLESVCHARTALVFSPPGVRLPGSPKLCRVSAE